jgi:hypothetical protein
LVAGIKFRKSHGIWPTPDLANSPLISQITYRSNSTGNRTSTKAGGDASGADLRSASYTANALNQYTSRDVPEYLNIMGIAHASASLTVNGNSPYRKGEFFRQELSINNTIVVPPSGRRSRIWRR